MPLTQSAIKKLAHDRKREKARYKVRSELKHAVQTMRKKPTKKSLTLVYSKLDKAANHSLIHANKAARLKSRLANLLTK